MNNQRIYNESIVLIGPVGAGKSLISNKLAEKTGMPIISTDIMRHCPKTVEEIKRRIDNLSVEIEKLELEIRSCKDEQHKNKLKDQVKKLYNEKWVSECQIEVRKILPNLPNYEEMGYNGDVANFLRDKFGDIGWHFYEK